MPEEQTGKAPFVFVIPKDGLDSGPGVVNDNMEIRSKNSNHEGESVDGSKEHSSSLDDDMRLRLMANEEDALSLFHMGS